MLVPLVQPVRLDRGADVGAGRHVVAGEVVVDVVAEPMVHCGLLGQGHAEPHRHPAEELGPGGGRVDHPADGVDPEQPGHPHLAGVGVHPHLGEVGPERVPGPVRVQRGDVVAGVDADLEAALGHARRHPGTQLPGRLVDRPGPGRGAHRAAGEARRRQRRVAHAHPDPVRRHAERVGGDLAEHRTGAGADVGGVDVHPEPAVPQHPRGGRGRAAAGRVGRRGHPGADQPAPVPPDAGPRVAAGPAEPVGAVAQAGDEIAAGERVTALRVDRRLVAHPQLDRVESTCDSQLVEGGLQRVHARGLAGRAHPGRRRHVEPGELVRGPPGGCRIHHPGADRGLLGELPHGRGLLDRLVADRPQHAVRTGAEPDPLDRRGAVADHAELVLPGQREAHRPADDPGRHRGQHDVGPGRALGPEPAADVRADHLDPVLGQPEQGGQGLRDAGRALVGVVHEQPVAEPLGRARVRLHRVVVRRRGLVRDVDGDRARGQLGVHVALRGVGRVVRVDLLRGVEVVPVGPQLGVVRLLVDAHPRARRRLPGRLQAVRDHGGDELAVVGDPIALEDQQLVVGDLGQPGRVAVPEHGQHSG